MPKSKRNPMQHNGKGFRRLSKEIGVNIFAMPFVLFLLNSPNNSVLRRFVKKSKVIRYLMPRSYPNSLLNVALS